MLFTTPVFLFIFLPITLIIYFISKDKYKNVILFIASMVFYSWGGLKYLILVTILIIVNYVSGLLIEKYKDKKKKKKIIFISTLLIDLGVLFFFKYFNFAIENVNKVLNLMSLENISIMKIALPIGISFFTFQILSYVIDVYNGKVQIQKNIINFGLYIMLFPQLIAGPIVRYIDIEKQMAERKITKDKVYQGIERFMIGFSKKILLSNMTGYIADTIFNNANYNSNSLCAWIGIICYALQIYHDFSGYSDMAIGLGKIFGFDFLENFNYPYISKSIKEFWRRWHISLSTWFKDYVYIPLGGNRKGKFKTYRNLLIVFFITGFWHGASWNFIVWGLFYGFFLVLERGFFGKVLEKVPSIIQRIYTLFIVLIAWVFFRAEGLTNALIYIKNMFSFNFTNNNMILKIIDAEHLFFIIIAIICCTPIICKVEKFINSKIIKNDVLFESISFISLLLIFNIAILYMTGLSYNPFIYFRF